MRYETRFLEDAKLVVVAYGSLSRIAGAAVENLRRQGKKIGFFRPLTLWPFPKKALLKVSKKAKKILTVEMSYGQMVEDVRLSVDRHTDVFFYGRSGGGIPTQAQIEREALKILKPKH